MSPFQEGGAERLAPPSTGRSFWSVVGIVLAVVLAVAGLAFVAFAILFVVAMNQWASNK